MTPTDKPPASHDTIADAIIARAQEGLVVGARVVVKLGGECQSHWHAGMNWGGSIGIVSDVEPAGDEAQHAEPWHVGHRYFVQFWDDLGGFFAAAELVVLPAADGPEQGGE